MAKAKITLIGFYNYMLSVNDDLFSKLSTPSGIDKTILVNNILLKGGEFEVLYAEPYFMQNMIGVWSDKWQHTMERWINALSIDYNPLENYDRMEDWTDDSSKVASATQDETMTNNSNVVGMQSLNNSNEENKSNIHSDASTNNEEVNRNENAIAEDYSASSGSGVTENERSSFDASTYQKHDKSTSTTNGENVSSGLTSADGKTETSGANTTNGISNDNTESTGSQNAINQNIASGDEAKNTKSNAIDNSSSVHQGRTHGNIGVTTSQQMLQAELDIAKWNLYDEIADLFLSELVIYLY